MLWGFVFHLLSSSTNTLNRTAVPELGILYQLSHSVKLGTLKSVNIYILFTLFL